MKILYRRGFANLLEALLKNWRCFTKPLQIGLWTYKGGFVKPLGALCIQSGLSKTTRGFEYAVGAFQSPCTDGNKWNSLKLWTHLHICTFQSFLPIDMEGMIRWGQVPATFCARNCMKGAVQGYGWLYCTYISHIIYLLLHTFRFHCIHL